MRVISETIRVYSDCGVYLGIMWFQADAWRAEDRRARELPFPSESAAREWLARQVIRDRVMP